MSSGVLALQRDAKHKFVFADVRRLRGGIRLERYGINPLIDTEELVGVCGIPIGTLTHGMGCTRPEVPQPLCILRGHQGDVQTLDYDIYEERLASG
jgi:hypothetical protein